MVFRLVGVVLVLAVASGLKNVKEDSVVTSVGSRIVGGIVSEPYSAPFIVSIALKGRQKNKQLCAGSIVAKQWIITGAHCLKEPPYRLIITAGIHSINITDSSIIQTRRCDFYRRHEKYSTIFGATGGFDLGLAHISTPFEFTKFIQPIFLPESLTQSPVGLATVFGWGSVSTTTKRDYPNQLHVANLTFVGVEACERAHNTSIGVGTLCAGGEKDNKGACIGDSGGPLVQGGSLVGIVSWGPPTCDPADGPTIFTNILYYTDWIKKQLQGDILENNILK